MRNDVQTGPLQGDDFLRRCSPFTERHKFEEANDNLWSARKLQLFWCPSSISLVPLIVDQGASILSTYSHCVNPYTNQVNHARCIFPVGEETRRIFICADIQDVQIIPSWAVFRASPEWIAEICSRSSLWLMSRVEIRTSSTFAQTSCVCSFPAPSAARRHIHWDGRHEVRAVRSRPLWHRRRMGRDKHS